MLIVHHVRDALAQWQASDEYMAGCETTLLLMRRRVHRPAAGATIGGVCTSGEGGFFPSERSHAHIAAMLATPPLSPRNVPRGGWWVPPCRRLARPVVMEDVTNSVSKH